MTNNPFAYSQPISKPDRFIGREDELRGILSELRREMSISIVGERRIGKTSLLKILQVESLGKGIYAEGSTLDAQETYYSSAEVSRHSFVILSFAPNLSSGGLRFGAKLRMTSLRSPKLIGYFCRAVVLCLR